MSQANQVAIAGPSALADPARPHQNNIPRFLLKLYEIVNDPANESLVKWSEAGDSFYIFNQEKFARELLGKWFKHQNFSSFVRQLNLYGFRKISALQQGLLRADNDSDTVQFAHPYFHRGQPDLLTLIQRKRNPPNQPHPEEGAVGLLQTSLSQDGGAQGSQAVDVRSIVEGINAIRRQQQAISADLSALKQSNDALWKEVIEARERHAKHEDTINRILKFLAGLFGRAVQGQNREQLHGEGKTPAPRRLMIGDGRPSHSEGGDYFGDIDVRSEARSRSQTPFSVASERFATVETPPVSTITEVTDHLPKSPPKPPRQVPNHTPQPSHTAAPSTSTQQRPNPDAVWQATLQQMLNAPDQFQPVLQTFANVPPYTIPSSEGSGSLGLFTPVQPPPQQPLTYPYPAPQSLPALPQANVPVAAAQPPAPQELALLNNAARLNKTYRDAAEIDADMDALQSNIHALIRDMGLDPNNVSFPNVNANGMPTAPGQPAVANGDLGAGASGDDFPFDSWLNQFGTQSGGAMPDLAYPVSPARAEEQDVGDLSAFLDLPAFDGARASDAAPVPAPAPRGGEPKMGAVSSPTGVKRKVDVVDIPEAPVGEAPSTKKKR